MATIQVRVNLKLDEVSDRARANVDKAIEKAAFDTEAHAKARAPVDTGLLRNSINHRRRGEAFFEVESPVHYSVFQEYGTSRMVAQPYMTPAVEVVKPSLIRAIQKATA